MINKSHRQQRNYYYDRIPLSLTLPDEEYRRFLSLFCYFTLYRFNKVNFDYYMPISKEKAHKLFQNKYYTYLNYCKEKGYLIEKIYGRTNEDKAITYSKDAGLCKAYRLNDNLIKELLEGNYSKNIISAPKNFKRTKTKKEKIMIVKREHELTEEDREIIEKLEANYLDMEVTIDESWQDQYNEPREENDLYEYYEVLEIVKKIDNGEFNISIGKNNGRVYSPLITMPKKFRKFMLFNGKPLYNVDMSSFHPFLLASFISDPARKASYVNFLKNNDIYDLFVDENHTRSQVKVAFQIFLGSFRYKGKVKDIYQWYRKNYPEILRMKIATKKAGSNCQLELQRIESEIFINKVFRQSDLWMIPAHDGDFILQDDIQAATDLIKRELEAFLKFDVTLKVEKV